MRPLCQACRRHPAAINCRSQDRIYYRKLCNQCIRRGRKLTPQMPLWQQQGYRKQKACDRCGFQARYASQLVVFHVNGNLRDCDVRNLRTVCLNCVIEVSRSDLPWRRGDLEEDR